LHDQNLHGISELIPFSFIHFNSLSTNTKAKLETAEHELLQWGITWHRGSPHSPHKITDEGKEEGVNVQVGNVQLPNGSHIHTLVYTHSHTNLVLPPLVLVHGYSQSASQFYAAAPALATRYPGQVVSIDHIGCGLSSRDKWEGGVGDSSDLRMAEALFVDSLEQWRAVQGYERMVLCGHSMGGYTSVRYCQQHSSRVLQLVLLSPVGVPEAPPVDPAAPPAVLPWYFRLGRYLWNKGYGPFDLARLVGRTVSE